jgi:hypothetical protein
MTRARARTRTHAFPTSAFVCTRRTWPRLFDACASRVLGLVVLDSAVGGARLRISRTPRGTIDGHDIGDRRGVGESTNGAAAVAARVCGVAVWVSLFCQVLFSLHGTDHAPGQPPAPPPSARTGPRARRAERRARAEPSRAAAGRAGRNRLASHRARPQARVACPQRSSSSVGRPLRPALSQRVVICSVTLTLSIRTRRRPSACGAPCPCGLCRLWSWCVDRAGGR